MKILIVGNYPFDRQHSMLRFGAMIERELAQLGCEARLLLPRAILFPKVARKDGIWKWVGYVNKFLLFPFELRRAIRSADVVHLCDHSNAMYIPWLRGRPHIVTVHDVIAIRIARGLDDCGPVGWSGRILQRLILRGLRQAQRAVCVSALTRDQLLELVPALRPRSTVVHSGLGFAFRPAGAEACAAVRRELGLGPQPYFLHVGENHPRKNRIYLVRLLAALLRLEPQLPHRIVLVGPPPGADERRAIAAAGLDERVCVLGNVDNEALCALYSDAAALIFPSLAEGFGWPIIEAQACGCPVLTSDRRPMSEIGGEAALYIDPLDPERGAQTLWDALPTLPERRAASLRNAARFSAAEMARAYLQAYRSACAEAISCAAASSRSRSDAAVR